MTRDRILALPTLVKHAPDPLRLLVGDLSDVEQVRQGLDLPPEWVAHVAASDGVSR